MSMNVGSFHCSLRFLLYRQKGNSQMLVHGGVGSGGRGGRCMSAALQMSHGCDAEQYHLLKLMRRRGAYLAASSCQNIIYVTEQIYNVSTPLHNTRAESTPHCCSCHLNGCTA